MQGKTSCVLALVLVCGVGRAGEPIPDGARFIGHLRKATVELVGVTYYRPNVKSRWWRPDGCAPSRTILDAPVKLRGLVRFPIPFNWRYEWLVLWIPEKCVNGSDG